MQSDNDTKSHRDWKSLAAVVGAVATLVVALTGLYVALEPRFFGDTTVSEDIPADTLEDVVDDPRLSAPSIPECNRTLKWPSPQSFTALRWQPVDLASSYAIEIHTRRRDDDPTKWTPYMSRRGVALRVMKSPAYSHQFVNHLRSTGSSILRWRVWAIGHDGVDGVKSVWCQIVFY